MPRAQRESSFLSPVAIRLHHEAEFIFITLCLYNWNFISGHKTGIIWFFEKSSPGIWRVDLWWCWILYILSLWCLPLPTTWLLCCLQETKHQSMQLKYLWNWVSLLWVSASVCANLWACCPYGCNLEWAFVLMCKPGPIQMFAPRITGVTMRIQVRPTNISQWVLTESTVLTQSPGGKWLLLKSTVTSV